MTYIHPTAIIGPNVTIGEDVYIGPYCVIGFPAEWKGREHEDKGVVIGDGARLTGLVTVDSGVERATFIGANAYLMKHSHVGHDAHIYDGAIISCGAKIGGHCEIGCHTNIGLNAVIHQKVEVPDFCMIGASAFVSKTLEMKRSSKYAGVPARYLGPNVKK